MFDVLFQGRLRKHQHALNMFVLQRARTPACCAPEIWATQEWDIVGWWWWRVLIPSVGPLGIRVEGESYSTLAETLGNEAWVQMCCGEANAWIMPSIRCQDLNMLQAFIWTHRYSYCRLYQIITDHFSSIQRKEPWMEMKLLPRDPEHASLEFGDLFAVICSTKVAEKGAPSTYAKQNVQGELAYMYWDNARTNSIHGLQKCAVEITQGTIYDHFS